MGIMNCSSSSSKAVGVMSNLLSDTARDGFVEGIAAEYAEARENHAGSGRKSRRQTLEGARANRPPIDWSGHAAPVPSFLGPRVFESFDLGELRACVDWTPFFRTWELAGKFPDILQDEIIGEAARDLYEDAQEMLDRMVAEQWLTPRAVVGFWPANADGDDIVLFEDVERGRPLATIHTLRQQMMRGNNGRPNFALADFVAPAENGVADYLGGFVVTAGADIDAIANRFEKNNDDYNAILAKALADRLADWAYDAHGLYVSQI